VTGGSRGIGAGIALRAAQLGARVALTYSSQADAAERVCQSLPGEGHMKLKMDVGDEASVNAGLDEVLKHFGGRLDGLVNNAGITSDQLLLRMKTEDFDRVLQTNLRGTFLCTRAAIKSMMKARAGAIVNVTSVIGQTGNAGQANYAASKAGIEAFTRSVALELGGRHVRANCVAPGFISTEMTDVLADAQKQGILEKVPLGSIGETVDVANAVCFLLSEEAKYITGHTLSVNGGLHM
jgi:3-oxoacyl-[acyl-carrier protein] reductase